MRPSENPHHRSLFFSEHVIDSRDVVPVGEALLTHDPLLLFEALIEDVVGWNAPADFAVSRSGRALAEKMTTALEVMRALPASEPPARVLVVPAAWFEDVVCVRCSAVRMRTGAALFDASSFACARSFVRRCGDALSSDELERSLASCDDKAALTGGWRRRRAGLSALSGIAWAEALALPLWLPRSLKDAERSAVLAHIFEAMTERGPCAGGSVGVPSPPAGLSGVRQQNSGGVEPAGRAPRRGGSSRLADYLTFRLWRDLVAAVDALSFFDDGLPAGGRASA